MHRQIGLDNIRSIDLFIAHCNHFAECIDWNAIPSVTDQKWRVTNRNIVWEEYASQDLMRVRWDRTDSWS